MENGVLDQRSVLDNNSSVAADRDGFPAAAIVLARRAIAIDPRNLAAHANLGSVLFRLGFLSEAQETARCLVASGSACAACEGYRILGMVATAQGDTESALNNFEWALRSSVPGDPERMVDVGYALMKLGDYARGFPLYQAACRVLCDYDHPDAPRWNGEEGANLLIVTDQGHGDQVMCSRFLPWAIARSRRVVLCVKPLEASLFAKVKDAEVVVYDWGAEKFDFQINTTGLVELHGCSPADNNIPPVVSYIDDSVKVPKIAVDGIKVGIVWTGNWNHLHTYFRDIPFLNMLRLAENPRVHLYSFQVGPPAADIAKHRAQRLVRDLSGQIEGDWAQTAAALRCMDYVVSADTGFVHVAATLGVPTLIMLPTYADWRWGVTGDVTPWYPRARLFRQDKFLEWWPVVNRIAGYFDEVLKPSVKEVA